MKKLTSNPISVLLVLTVFAFTMFLTPAETKAAYHDHSDELPGMDFNLTPYLVVGGVLIGAALIYRLAKHSSDKTPQQPEIIEDAKAADDEKEVEDESKAETNDENEDLSLTDYGDLTKSKVNMYFDIDPHGSYGSESSALDFSNMTVKVGFKVSF